MLDKIKNNCYNHHSEIHKGHEQQSSIYTWSVTATCLRTGPETLDGALWNVTVCKGANSNDLLSILYWNDRRFPERYGKCAL